MASYTPEEVQVAVEKLVRSTVRRPYGELGNRDVNTPFSDTIEAASGTYALFENALYYTVGLGITRLLGVVHSLSLVSEELIELIANTNRRAVPVANLSPLQNARAALDALSTTTSSRTKGFPNIEEVPAFRRFKSNIDRFLDESGQQSVVNGKTTPTPQEARDQIAGKVTELKSQHAELVRVLNSLAASEADFAELNLPDTLSSGVVQRARSLLTTITNDLESLDPTQRLARMKDVSLDLLAARTVVENFSSLAAPTRYVNFLGSGEVFASAEYPATPAKLTVDNPQYYSLVDNSAEVNTELDFVVDSSFSFQLVMGGGYVLRLQGSTYDTYRIVDTVSLPDDPYVNDKLSLRYNDGADHDLYVTFPLGTAISATALATAINAEIATFGAPWTRLEAKSLMYPLRYTGDVVIGGAYPGAVTHTGTSDWADLGITAGLRVRILNTSYLYTVTSVAGNVMTCTQDSGGFITGSQTIEIGSGYVLNVGMTPAAEKDSLTRGDTLTALGEADDADYWGALTVGMLSGSISTSRPVSSETVETSVNTAAASALGDKSRLGATTEYLAIAGLVTEGLQGACVLPSAQDIALFYFRGRLDVTTGGLAAVFTIPDGYVPLVGQEVVIRDTATLANMGVRGFVTAVGAQDFNVTMDTAVVAESDMLVTISPDLSAVPVGHIIRVDDSSINGGDYAISASSGGYTSQFAVTTVVPLHAANSGLPSIFPASVGQTYVSFESTATDLTTSVQVHNPSNPESGADQFFNTLPAAAVGTTTYFKLPQFPRQLEVGDALELFENVPTAVSRSFDIVGLNAEESLLELSEGLEVSFGSIDMSVDTQVPFARVRKAKKNTFDTFSTASDSWLGLEPNQDVWWSDLNRLVNPLTGGSLPTVSEVNAARVHVQALYGILTTTGSTSTGGNPEASLEAVLGAYSVSHQPEVDTLIDTLRDRGSDRGVDILLEGRFSDFFSLDVDGLSYAGAVAAAVKDVAREDMAVQKVDRGGAASQGVTIAEWEDPDYEYDLSDLDDTDEDISPTGVAGPASPGSTY